MRTNLLLLTAFLLAGSAYSSELIPPKLLPGAATFRFEKLPLPDLLKKEWGSQDWLGVVKGSDTKPKPIRYVKSCIDLKEAQLNDEYAPDSAGMGLEHERNEYCQNIRRLMLAKPARKNGLASPLCLDKSIYLALVGALKSPWGLEGLLRIEEKRCGVNESEAIVTYNRIIEPKNEMGGGQSAGVVNIRYLVQGDFDHDGWLDLIAEVYMEPDFSAGNWFRSESGVSGVVKISRVKGVLSITTFADLQP